MSKPDEENLENELGTLLGFLKGLVFDRAMRRRVRKASFIEKTLEQFQHSYELTDESIGTWFATMAAADWGDNLNSDHVSIEFSITHNRQPVPKEIRSRSVLTSIEVYRDFGKPQTEAEEYFLVYDFTDFLSISQNMELFREFAILQIKDTQREPPRVEERSSRGILASADTGKMH